MRFLLRQVFTCSRYRSEDMLIDQTLVYLFPINEHKRRCHILKGKH